jgi:hypothetical protein
MVRVDTEVVQCGDMELRHDKDMHRRLRIDVFEGDHPVVFKNLRRRNLAGNDAAEEAVGGHARLLAAFHACPKTTCPKEHSTWRALGSHGDRTCDGRAWRPPSAAGDDRSNRKTRRSIEACGSCSRGSPCHRWPGELREAGPPGLLYEQPF